MLFLFSVLNPLLSNVPHFEVASWTYIHQFLVHLPFTDTISAKASWINCSVPVWSIHCNHGAFLLWFQWTQAMQPSCLLMSNREKETIWIFRLCVSNNCNGFFPLQSSLPFINHPIVVIKVHNSKVSLHRKDKTGFLVTVSCRTSCSKCWNQIKAERYI